MLVGAEMVLKKVAIIDNRVVTEMESAEVDAGETKLSYRDWFAQQYPMGQGK